MKINVIGAGTWGIVIATYLSNKGHSISVYHRESKKSTNIINSHIHPNLSNLIIPNEINFNSNFKDLNSNNLNILTVPSHAISDCMNLINIDKGRFLILTKGFDEKTGMLPYEVLINQFLISENSVAVLSGPNHAEEIANNKPTTSIVASIDSTFSKELQILLSSNTFRIYTSNDILGVQLGAAVKNIIAIGSGICVGLNLGDNTQASLIARGMNEILELSKVYDVEESTLYGLSGLGDLIVTCYSKHSRNRKLGVLLAEGKNLSKAQDRIGMVCEGISSSFKLNKIINDNNLNMPICTEVYNILFNNSNPLKSINTLMMRQLKDEK